jgi:hypothetical protein
MKRTLAALVAITFLGSSLSLPAFAAVKAGAKCPKAGKISVASGKTFTCIKSGKKLVWSKGIAVAKPVAAAPVPSPSATSQPVAEKIPPMPTSFDDLEEKHEGIPYASWKFTQEKLDATKSTDLKITFKFGPNTSERYENQWSIDAINLGSRVMGAQKQPKEFVFLQFSKPDVPWARNEANNYVSTFRLGQSIPDQISDLCAGADCDNGVTNLAGDIGLVIVGVPTPPNKFGIQKFKGQTDLHEYVHAVQGMVFKGKAQNPPPTLMPCWYSEGQPQAISIVTTSKTAESYVSKRKEWVNMFNWPLKDYEPSTIEEFMRNNMKVPCPGNTNALNYTVGFIIMDSLVAIGGIDKTFEVLTAIADGLKFEDAFQKVYGKSWAEASGILARVVSKVYEEYRK